MHEAGARRASSYVSVDWSDAGMPGRMSRRPPASLRCERARAPGVPRCSQSAGRSECIGAWSCERHELPAHARTMPSYHHTHCTAPDAVSVHVHGSTLSPHVNAIYDFRICSVIQTKY